jgi:type IV pilus assembly protein PilP
MIPDPSVPMRWLLVLPLSGLLLACADPEMDALESYANQIKQRPPAKLEPIPEMPVVDSFIYLPLDRRDPFAMDAQSAEVADQDAPNGLAPDPTRPKEPLEAYSLDGLRMVGTLQQDQARWALITAPDGVLYRVGVGNHLGRNHGEIVAVEPEKVQLSELIQQRPGRWEKRDASIALTE